LVGKCRLMGLQGIQVVITVERATDAEIFSSLG
jgi:hypothetical protein